MSELSFRRASRTHDAKQPPSLSLSLSLHGVLDNKLGLEDESMQIKTRLQAVMILYRLVSGVEFEIDTFRIMNEAQALRVLSLSLSLSVCLSLYTGCLTTS